VDVSKQALFKQEQAKLTRDMVEPVHIVVYEGRPAVSVTTDSVKVEQNRWPWPRSNARRQLSALHFKREQDEAPKELDQCELGGAGAWLVIGELGKVWLWPGQSVAVGWQEVMVIRVVDRTVIVGSVLR
jgi:hypothetical protein